jgi:hypothetical protein
MSKRELYESIINFRTSVDTSFNDGFENTYPEMDPPKVELPKYT